MLTIRSQQMDAILQEQRVEKALRHVCEFFPAECSQLGQDKLEKTVRSALERAASYGFHHLRDALQFLDLVCVFGPDFERNLPWAREILEERSAERPHFRATRLYQRALATLRARS